MRRRAFLKACLGATIACVVPIPLPARPRPLTFDVIQSAVARTCRKGSTPNWIVVHPDTWRDLLGDLTLNGKLHDRKKLAVLRGNDELRIRVDRAPKQR